VTNTKKLDLEALPKRTKVLIGAAAIVIVGGGITLALFVGGRDDETAAAGPTATPTAPAIEETPAAAPTKSTDQVIEELGGGLDHDDSDHDHDHEGDIDVAAEQQFALDGVKQWVNWDSNESPEARAARLAPFFGADSDMLDEVPASANEAAMATNDARTLTQVDSGGFAGIVAATDEIVTLDVTFRYKSLSEYDGYRLNYSEGAVWRVDVPRGLPAGSVLLDLDEPTLRF